MVGIEYEGLGPKRPPEANDFHPPIHFWPNYITLENLWHSWDQEKKVSRVQEVGILLFEQVTSFLWAEVAHGGHRLSPGGVMFRGDSAALR